MLFNTEGTEDTERVFIIDTEMIKRNLKVLHRAMRLSGNLQKLFLTERQVEIISGTLLNPQLQDSNP